MPRAGYPHAGQIDDRVSSSDAAVIGERGSRGAVVLDMSISRPFPLTAMGYPVILLLTPLSLTFSASRAIVESGVTRVIYGTARLPSGVLFVVR